MPDALTPAAPAPAPAPAPAAAPAGTESVPPAEPAAPVVDDKHQFDYKGSQVNLTRQEVESLAKAGLDSHSAAQNQPAPQPAAPAPAE